MVRTRTIVVIIKLKEKVEIDYRRSIFGSKRRVLEKEVHQIEIDKPVLIFPDVAMERIEIVPITEKTVIHTKNFKRDLRP